MTTPEQRRRPRSGRFVVSTTVALMLAYGVTPAQCFQSVSGLSVAEPRVATRHFFRNVAETTTPTFTFPFVADSRLTSVPAPPTIVQQQQAQQQTTTEQYSVHLAQQQQQAEASYEASQGYYEEQLQASYDAYQPAEPAYYTEQQQYAQPEAYAAASQETAYASYTTNPYSQPQAQQTHLPTWLADSKDALWESAWYSLEYAMLQSLFTPQEIQPLFDAIQTAARGDRHQMASAAEFCLILVETMEMGLTALMAAAYHVCACVTVCQHPGTSTSSFYDHAFDGGTGAISAENHHVALVAKDAGRLQELEMVAAMIYSDKAASKATPNQRDAENLCSLLLTETKDWRALAIRSAAALYRLKGILKHAQQAATGVGGREIPHVTPEALQCSRKALYIYAPLASRLGMHRLKNELEGAAFRILYRRQYETVNRMARELRPRHSKPHLNRGLVEMCDHTLDTSSCMKNVLETVKVDMTQLLVADPHFAEHVQDFSVTARVKEPYSLWKKMLRNKCTSIRQVPDAIALRIVLEAKPNGVNEDENVKRARERALCYYAQQLCSEHWQPVPNNPRFKDYIESPKRNGYQSLHYTAHTCWDEEDWNLEIQVRSQEMHQVAEFGLASHWDYKQQQTLQAAHDEFSPEQVTLSQDQSSDAYLRSVQEWHWQQQSGQDPELTADTSDERADRIRARTKKLQPYIQALTAAQSDLARDHVFVFLTTSEHDNGGSGSVLALPAGACVLDALREGEREWGFPFPDEIRLNGELLEKVTGKLQNGDILTVPVGATAMA